MQPGGSLLFVFYLEEIKIKYYTLYDSRNAYKYLNLHNSRKLAITVLHE